MASVQKQDRLQVVQFIEISKRQRDDWRSFTAKHFIAQSMAKSPIYQIMKRYELEGSVARATGSRRLATKIIREHWSNLDGQLTTKPQVVGYVFLLKLRRRVRIFSSSAVESAF